MNFTWLRGAAAVAVSLLVLAACERHQDAADAEPYEACDYATVGEPCGVGPTTCQTGGLESFDGYCTQSCDADDDCLVAEDFAAPVCLQLYAGRQCALPCRGSEDCPLGNTCAELEQFDGGSMRVCQPEEA